MPTAFITGANGFIGRVLCARLVAAGWSVRAAVYPPGSPVPAGAAEAPVGGIDGGTEWAPALAGVEVVVHLAARVHVMREPAPDPLEAFRTVNVAGTRRLAQEAAVAGAKRLVFLSTVGVHGASAEAPLTEDSPLRPHNEYSRSKLEAEQVLTEVSRCAGLEAVVVRAPLVYGPGGKGNFERLLEVLRRGWPLPLASVDNRRSFIYVENLVDALMMCANLSGAAGRTYLVSDGVDISTPKLIRELSAALGRPARLIPCPVGLLRMAGACLDISSSLTSLTESLVIDSGRVRRELGWVPRFALSEGLSATAKWYLESR